MVISLVGNQNSGKTSIFNKITKMNQHVGNFPGVTVDITVGKVDEYNDCEIIDLPGLYSLSTYSKDENVTKEFLYKNKPEVVINVIDCMNLQRGLYLTMQLKQLGIPVVMALNMLDDLEKNNGKIDINKLENILKIPIIPITKITDKEIKELLKKSREAARKQEKINQITVKENAYEEYKKIDKICKEVLYIPKNKREIKSYKIDKILTNKFLGIPIFILIMYCIFKLTFDVIGDTLSEILQHGIDVVSNYILIYLNKMNSGIVIESLIIDGILKGIGAVLSFLPIIVTLYLCLSILEDSGYMTRIAFIMDKLFKKIGLSGRSIVPILLGFGCSVPAILSIRTIESEKEKNLALNLVPFISCSAKIPIYGIFVQMFFKENQALAMLGLYLIGILIGIVVTICIKMKTNNKSENLFLLELPNYRMPSLKNTWHLMWNKISDFLSKSFTIIFFTSMIIWLLKSFDLSLCWVTEDKSMLAMISKKMLPLFTPIGFKDWKIITACITGISAKESILSTLTILSNTNIESIVAEIFTIESAISFMIFTLLYTPCIAALGVIKKEFGIKKAINIGINQLFIAYIISFITFNLVTVF